MRTAVTRPVLWPREQPASPARRCVRRAGGVHENSDARYGGTRRPPDGRRRRHRPPHPEVFATSTTRQPCHQPPGRVQLDHRRPARHILGRGSPYRYRSGSIGSPQRGHSAGSAPPVVSGSRNSPHPGHTRCAQQAGSPPPRSMSPACARAGCAVQSFAHPGPGERGHESWQRRRAESTVEAMTINTSFPPSARRTGRLAAAGAAALTAAVVLAACGSADDDSGAAATDEQVTVEVDESDASTEAFNDADVMFAQMMIPHHAQALEMAEIMLHKDGLDPEVVTLVEQIRDAQGPEIELMTDWLADWDAPLLDPADPEVAEMDGMVPAEGIDQLRAAEGAEAEQLFLAQMIEHHVGAVDMAEEEIADGIDPAAIALAEEIITAQQTEIEQMTAMLDD